MKHGISRTRMRISVVLFVIGLILLLAGYAVDGWITTIPALVLIIAGMAVKPGKCPTCGKFVGPAPQWSEAGKYHCRYCGARLAYNDEAEEEA